MPLGTKVGLGPGHIVLDRDRAPLPTKKEQSPQFLAHVLWPNGWIDQDASQYGGRPRPRPRPHIVLDGDPAHPFKGAQPISGPCLLWPNGWMDQDATWYGDRPEPRPHC